MDNYIIEHREAKNLHITKTDGAIRHEIDIPIMDTARAISQIMKSGISVESYCKFRCGESCPLSRSGMNMSHRCKLISGLLIGTWTSVVELINELDRFISHLNNSPACIDCSTYNTDFCKSCSLKEGENCA